MKAILKLLTLFAFSFATIMGQTWTQLTSGTTYPINDIFFLNKNVGWFVSHYGLIRKTIDGGLSWVTQTNSTQSELKAVQFLDINLGYIVGGSGTVLKTTNGGGNWIQLNTGYTGYFYGIDFISRDIGWIVGSDGKIFKTTDGGSTWVNQSPINNETFFDVDFIDANVGTAVGTSGSIYRTYLGGSDWFRQDIGPTTHGFYAVNLCDIAKGWIAGSDGLRKTTNAGSNWNYVYFLTSAINKIFFLNLDTGWVVTNNGVIGSTVDGGQNFTYRSSTSTERYNSVFFLDPSIGWVVGSDGILLKYSTPQQLTLTAPNGGENWQVGSSHNITWTQTNVSNVKIEYTTNNGSSWTQIIASTPASTGSYSWTVPNTASTNCKIKISDVANNAVTDQSDNNFSITIAPTITVISPDGGENWQVGSSHNITWIQTNVSNVKLEYTTNNGTTWIQVVASIPASSGSYSWTIPNTVSTNCRVRITDVSNSSVTDQSNSNFTISAAPSQSVTVTSPNGGESWQVGTSHNITWAQTGVSNIKIEYTTNNGSSWSLIVGSTPASSGSYSWTIPNTVSSSCRVRISDAANSSVSDQSNAVFTISAAPVFSVQVTSPNGGERWFAETQYSITWNSANVEDLKLEYTSDGGASWTQIAGSVAANLGSYIWTIPNTPSSNCKVRLTSVANPGVADESDAAFTIAEAPKVTLTSPNGGEIWMVGRQYSITWTAVSVNKLRGEYSTDGGTMWILIADTILANLGSYIWTIPNTESGNCLVRLSGIDQTSAGDQSDAPFTIELERSLALTAPVPGETYTSGRILEIKWSQLNVDLVDLLYSTDDGAYWQYIADSISSASQSYNWLIPELNSNQVKIRAVASQKQDLRSDLSGNITILPSPKVRLLSNIAGTYLKAGNSYRIEWFVENVSAIDLHLSSDGGTTWNSIASNLPATVRSHEWTVPTVNSNSCMVKVVSVDDPGLFSVNQSSFTIYTYSQTVGLSHSWRFGDIKDISNYRLISIPGYISENLGDLMPGKHVNDWNAYWDNGDDANYQIQYDGGSRFVIQPGKGFWVLSKEPVNMTRQSAAVTIDSTLKFAIPLHNGWNIIGNVFTKPLDWAGIRSANSLPHNSLLYFWDGSWTFPAQMEPYKGYYFFNGDNRQSLNLVYPVTAGLAKTNNGTQFPAVKGSVAISFAGNEIVAGLDEESTTGLDTNDYMLPGISFSDRSVAFLSHSQDGKLRQLFIESQPCDSIGNSFKIEVKNNSTEITKLRFRSVLEQERVNVYLLDEKYNEFIDLRTRSEFDIIPQRDNRYFTLLIGDNAFINSMKANYLPGEYELYQNYPNPFNPETSIKYALPKDGSVKIRLYDILGNEIMTLFDGEETAGVHSRSFDLSGLASGVYLYRLEAGDKSLVKKLVLLK